MSQSPHSQRDELMWELTQRLGTALHTKPGSTPGFGNEASFLRRIKERIESLQERSGPEGIDPLAQWKARPSAEEIENHYPGSQHQPDECEMCRFIHDAAKAYLGVAVPEAGPERCK